MIASPPKASTGLLASPLVVEAPTKLNACPISFRVQGGTGGFACHFAFVSNLSAAAPARNPFVRAVSRHRGAGFQPAMPAFLRAFFVAQAFLPVFLLS